MIQLDEYGIPIVQVPIVQSTVKYRAAMFCLIHIVFPIVLPLVLVKAALKNSILHTLTTLKELCRIVTRTHRGSVLSLPQNKDKDLIGKLWKQPSAYHYIENDALEYQQMEGYCGRSTLRNILKSFPSFPKDLIPKPSGGATNPKKWSKVIHDLADERYCKMPPIKTKVISGDLCYEKFMKAIIDSLKDPSCRIALNFLRPALVGFRSPIYIPAFFMLSLVSGHFSPILGMFEEDKEEGRECMIGVFDVNHKFGGAYLVPSRMLYESVKAQDLTTGRSRALVILKMGEGSKAD
eukprot:scaffold1674_cov284-Chaetoceros_neogracile.AAC.3